MNVLQHPELGRVSYSTQQMSVVPDEQVKQAIAQMSRYVLEDSQRPEILKDAALAAGTADGDPVEGAYNYARKKIRFVEDRSVITSPNVVEVLIRPVDVSLLSQTLGAGTVVGDCDDFSMYVAAMLLAQGVPCCFATVAADEADPTVFSHVYVVAYPRPGKRVPVDASHGKFCGWEAPNRFGRLQEWDIYESAKMRATSSVGLMCVLALAGLGYWYYVRGGFDV